MGHNHEDVWVLFTAKRLFLWAYRAWSGILQKVGGELEWGVWGI